MMEDLKAYLGKILSSTEGLLGIVITDRDGVPLVKAATQEAPELGMRPGFLSPFGIMTEQAGKLGMGKNKSIICMYSNYQVIHFNKLPFIITVFGLSSANTGLLLTVEDSLAPILSQLHPVLEISNS